MIQAEAHNQIPQVWRPTLRADKRYQAYVEELFRSTNLDRNQIIRAALFAAPFSGAFRNLIEKHLVAGRTDCPTPLWDYSENDLWLQQCVEALPEFESDAL